MTLGPIFTRARCCLCVLLAFGWMFGCDSPSEKPRAGVKAGASVEKGVPDENGMCSLHGVPHELCTKCNPALAQVFKAKGDWCDEHGFPESYCPVCNPNAEIPGYTREAKDAAPTPNSESAEQAETPPADGRPSVGEIEGRVVRFASPEIERSVDIGVVAARAAKTSPSVSCAARIAFDADRIADVRALVPGIVRKIEVEVGDEVEAGARLFLLESERIGSVQSDLQTARERVRVAKADLDRKLELRNEQITSARAVELARQKLAEAEAEETAAASMLRIAGAPRGKPSGRYTLDAPMSGQVIRRPAVLGALATADVSLATIANTSKMWVICEVPEQDAHLVQRGQTLSFTLGSREVQGPISWLSPEVDPRTRTVAVRAEVENPDGRLRANQFANAIIRTGAPEDALLVPRDAIQRIEGYEVLFVRAKPGLYLPRVVETFEVSTAEVAVTGKLAVGEEVVTQGAVLLRTEAMPGSIGAGCCEVGVESDDRGGE